MHGRMRTEAARARSYQVRSCLGIEYECASRVSHNKSGSHAFLRLTYEFPKSNSGNTTELFANSKEFMNAMRVLRSASGCSV